MKPTAAGLFWLGYAAVLSGALACCTRDAHGACVPSVAVTVASIHFPDRGFNQRNPGLGVECDARDWAIGAGEYRNSYRRTTVYAIGAWLPLHLGGWSFGAAVGPATGYRIPVLGGLMARYRSASPIGMNLLLAPPAEKNGSAMLGLQLTYRF